MSNCGAPLLALLLLLLGVAQVSAGGTTHRSPEYLAPRPSGGEPLFPSGQVPGEHQGTHLPNADLARAVWVLQERSVTRPGQERTAARSMTSLLQLFIPGL